MSFRSIFCCPARDDHAGRRPFQHSNLVGWRTDDTLHFYIRDEFIREMHCEMFASQAAITLPPCVGVMDEMLQTIANEIRKMLLTLSAVDRVYAETLSRTVAAHLVRNYISGRRFSINDARTLTPRQCNRAIEYIEECSCDNLTLAGIAQAAGVSTGRLNSEFKRSMKLAPYQYVLNARVRRAQRYVGFSTDLYAGSDRSPMRLQQPATHDAHGPPHDWPHAWRHPPRSLIPGHGALRH